MDKKTVREAIKHLLKKKIALEHKYPRDSNGKIAPNKEYDDVLRSYRIAIEALEKQLPKKPIIKTEKEVPYTHNLGRLLRFHCPNCGKFIVAIYESDTERGGGISNSLKGCSTCLQAIDFSEYYTKRDVGDNKLNEDIEWSN